MDPGDFSNGPIPNANATAGDLHYFESSWGVLSTIGITNVLLGVVIVGITSLSPVTIVPIVCSIGSAVANALCFYGFYTHHRTPNRAAASAFADIFWFIGEVGLSFYSYVILRRVLRNRQRIIFLTCFWVFIASLAALRTAITVLRLRSILEDYTNFQVTITHLHCAYFAIIGAVECVSAYFLLRKFATAQTTSLQVARRVGFFQYLMRSTEVRVALLALIGISRAITYSFQVTAQSATTVASSVDRFVYVLETMFPIVLYFDILASKLRFNSQGTMGSTPNQRVQKRKRQTSQESSRTQQFVSSSWDREDFTVEPKPRGNTIEVQSRIGMQMPQSQERIVEEGQSRRTASASVDADTDAPADADGRVSTPRSASVDKTVEWRISRSPGPPE